MIGKFQNCFPFLTSDFRQVILKNLFYSQSYVTIIIVILYNKLTYINNIHIYKFSLSSKMYFAVPLRINSVSILKKTVYKNETHTVIRFFNVVFENNTLFRLLKFYYGPFMVLEKT